MKNQIGRVENSMIHSSCNKDRSLLTGIVDTVKILEPLSGQNPFNCSKTKDPVFRAIKVFAVLVFGGEVGEGIIMRTVLEGLPFEDNHFRAICKRSKSSERIRDAMNKSQAKTKIKAVP